MTPLILNGKEVAGDLYSQLPDMKGKKLVIITIGDDDASKVYVRNKILACNKVGLDGINYKFYPSDYKDITSLADAIFRVLDNLNKDDTVVGIMIQKPYLKELNDYNFEDYISPDKDVDGLNSANMVKTLSGKTPKFYPATPKGIIKLLDYYNIPIEGKNVVVIGRSDIVGKPLAAMMTARNATVLLAHSKTHNLKFYTRSADIIISAVGKPKFIDHTFIAYDSRNPFNALGYKPIIIDVGTNRDEDGKLCGDVDFDDVLPYVSGISKSPGGVGPMTIWGLMDNCCKYDKEI